MGARLSEIVIESTDPAAAAEFWSRALGWQRRAHQPGDVPWVSASGDPAGPDLKLVFVPLREGRPPGNRLYVNPVGAPLDEEVARLTGLGAHRATEGTKAPWVALVDPGGTALTVLPNREDEG